MINNLYKFSKLIFLTQYLLELQVLISSRNILKIISLSSIKSLSASTAITSIKPSSEHTETGIIKVNGMKCAGCVNSVKSTLLKLNGVYGADVSLLGTYCNIEYNNQIISVNDIRHIQRLFCKNIYGLLVSLLTTVGNQ